MSWTVGDLELLGARGTDPVEYGCYPMAPWAGRVPHNIVTVDNTSYHLPASYNTWALHGTVLDAAWSVVRRWRDAVCLAVNVGPPWPWAGQVRLTWTLTESRLSSELTLTSSGEAFPARIGWHPWFRRRLARGGDLQWQAAAVALLERGPDRLPTGRRLDPAEVVGPYDDAFEVPSGRAELTWPNALHMTCHTSAHWMVVFDQLPDLVCVEPQTAPPGELGVGDAWVRPGDPLEARVTWTWADLTPTD